MKREEKNERVEMTNTQALGMLTPEDGRWLLCAALLDNIADDLAVTRCAGWWQDHPREMADNFPEATMLLKELASDPIRNLMDNVTCGTRGAVACDLGWMMRIAKHKSARMGKPKLTRETVAFRIQLPALTAGRAAYHAPHCKCGAQIKSGSTCQDCIRKKQESDAQKRRDLTEARKTGISFFEWLRRKGCELGITPKAVRWRLKKGHIKHPEVIYESKCTKIVKP